MLSEEERKKRRKISVAKYKAGKRPETLRKYILDNYEWYLFNSARTRCRRLGIEFTIELSDVIIPEVCPYLEVPMTRIMGKGRQDYNPSIDRIDPEKGYVSGNIQVISDKANRMKNNATAEELRVFCHNVLEMKRR